MIQTTTPRWEAMRTDESRMVEETLRNVGFLQVDSYRYNPASIRVRVIDPRFEGLKIEKRYELIEPHLERLPEHTQADIMSLFTFAPSELNESPKTLRQFMKNTEFEDPSPSML